MVNSIPCGLGLRLLPTVFTLLDLLRKHVEWVLNKVEDDDVERVLNKVEDDDDADYPPIPVVDLYSDDPWHVLNDEDRWIVHNCNDLRLNFARRSILVFTELKPLGRKRFVRSAGSGTWDGATGHSKILWGDDGDAECVGTKKYFDFKSTESSRGGENGHWRMNEYRLAGEMLKGLEDYSLATRIVVCEITQEVDTSFGIHLGWTKMPLDEYFSYFLQLGLRCLRRPYHDDDGEGKQLPDQEIEENLSMYNADEREIEGNGTKRIENRKELLEDWSTISSDKWRTVSSTMPHDSDTAQLGQALGGKKHEKKQLMTIEETYGSTGDETQTSNPSVGDQYQIARAPEAGLHGFQTAGDGLVRVPETFYMELLAKADQEHREFAQVLGLPVPAHQPSEFIEFL